VSTKIATSTILTMGCTQSQQAVSDPSQQVTKKHNLGDNLIVRRKKDFRNDYEIIKQVGEGSISNIYMVKRKGTHYGNETDETEGTMTEDLGSHDVYALKQIDSEFIKPESFDEMKNEIDLMRKIDHPNSKYRCCLLLQNTVNHHLTLPFTMMRSPESL
jgi:serine/threonine protein kinase